MQRKPRMMILASAAERPKIPSGLAFAGDAMFVVGEVIGRESRELFCMVRRKVGGWRRSKKHTMIKEVVGEVREERRSSSRYSASERARELEQYDEEKHRVWRNTSQIKRNVRRG
jgi:hypothetical protein